MKLSNKTKIGLALAVIAIGGYILWNKKEKTDGRQNATGKNKKGCKKGCNNSFANKMKTYNDKGTCYDVDAQGNSTVGYNCISPNKPHYELINA